MTCLRGGGVLVLCAGVVTLKFSLYEPTEVITIPWRLKWLSSAKSLAAHAVVP